MTFTIPDANGLAQELVSRFGEDRLRLSDTLEKRLGMMEMRETEVFLDDKKIGDVKVNFYMGGSEKNTRVILMVSYAGTIPGYVNPNNETGEISISAHKDKKGQEGLYIDISSNPNNTQTRPLYRTDGHQTIRLADHEVDGRIKSGGIDQPKNIAELK